MTAFNCIGAKAAKGLVSKRKGKAGNGHSPLATPRSALWQELTSLRGEGRSGLPEHT